MHQTEIIFFTVFTLTIIAFLLIDLLLIGKKEHIVSAKEAAIWSTIWISLGLLFGVFLKFHGELIHGIKTFEDLAFITNNYAENIKLIPGDFEKSLQIFRNHQFLTYITGYLIEKTLSVDNLFVMMMILSGFGVRKQHYKPVLFWGILGAIILRSLFIFAGAALIHKFSWLLLVFGGFLIYSGVKMYIDRNKEEKIEPQNHKLVKFLSKYLSVFPKYVSQRFFIIYKGKFFITPLFIVLIIIEFSDLVFAFDSIPAIFAVTIDPYIVFFSNIFAILGLRALFFLLIKIVDKFWLLKPGVSILLVFIGLKLLFHNWLDEIGFETVYSLIFISAVLVFSIVFSLLFPKKEKIQN
ncbi:MAG: TerC/Alx family metal homeostasis membrane protein [Bacteroidales bacterium]|nr:TerC/Alx family metal homeostasis membrane protein [Bacteroidales bacterium]MBN2756881.1 TerC/Alx family metal homeostasis membrane protein [Bacteroidales bacterium]